MVHKRILFGFSRPYEGADERPSKLFYRAAAAAWWSFLLCQQAVSSLLAEDLKKRPVNPFTQLFRGFVCVTVVGASCYAIWHPGWIFVVGGALIVLVGIEEMFAPPDD